MNKKLISWGDYLYLGLLFAVLMTIGGEESDGFYQLVFLALFFVLSGAIDNLRLLKDFVKKFPGFAAFALLSTLYFIIAGNTELVSYRFAGTVFFLVFAGYCISVQGIDHVKASMEKLWGVLFVLLASAAIRYVFFDHFVYRMNLYFKNPITEGAAAVVMLMISLFVLEDRVKRAAGTVMSLLAVMLSVSRNDLLLVAAVFAAYLILNWNALWEYLKEKTGADDAGRQSGGTYSKSGKKKIIVGAVMVLLAILLLSALITMRNSAMASNLGGRFTAMFASLGQDPYLNYYGDIGFRYRIVAPVEAIRLARTGTLMEILFGRGLKSTFSTIGPATTILSQNDIAGPVENAFICFLADFGVLFFIMYLGTYIAAIRAFFTSKERLERVMALFVVITMSTTLFADLQYWSNVAYFIWVSSGLWLGCVTSRGDRKTIVMPYVFSACVAVIIYRLPGIYLWLRTVITATDERIGGAAVAIFLFVFFVGLCAFVWSACLLVISFALTRESDWKGFIGASSGAVLIILLVSFGNVQTGLSQDSVTWRMDAEEAAIMAIKEGAVGEIYCDTYPAIYNARFGGIKGTLFSGASLATMKDTTVIMDISEEAQRLTNEGFMYLPVSEWDAVYTNDPGAIKALGAAGYELMEYHPGEYRVDLGKLASLNGLQMTDSGAIRLGGTAGSITQGPDLEVLPGGYTVTYKFRLESAADAEEHQVCSLSIRLRDVITGAESEAASAVIMSSMFDEKGELSYGLDFDGGSGDTDFLVQMDSGDGLLLESIECVRVSR